MLTGKKQRSTLLLWRSHWPHTRPRAKTRRAGGRKAQHFESAARDPNALVCSYTALFSLQLCAYHDSSLRVAHSVSNLEMPKSWPLSLSLSLSLSSILHARKRSRGCSKAQGRSYSRELSGGILRGWSCRDALHKLPCVEFLFPLDCGKAIHAGHTSRSSCLGKLWRTGKPIQKPLYTLTNPPNTNLGTAFSRSAKNNLRKSGDKPWTVSTKPVNPNSLKNAVLLRRPCDGCLALA